MRTMGIPMELTEQEKTSGMSNFKLTLLTLPLFSSLLTKQSLLLTLYTSNHH